MADEKNMQDQMPYAPDPNYNKMLKGAMDVKPSNILMFHAISHGGLLNRADLALKIAELLACNVYDETSSVGPSMAGQRPLEIRDDGDRWTILGNLNRKMENGSGPLKVVLRKWDAAVLDLVIPELYTAPGDEDKTLDSAETLRRWAEKKSPA